MSGETELDAVVEYDLTLTGSPADRQDPLQTFAMTVLAVTKQARLVGGSAIISRVLIAATDDVGRPTVITAHLRLSAPDVQTLRTADEAIRRQARERADRDGTSVVLGETAHQ